MQPNTSSQRGPVAAGPDSRSLLGPFQLRLTWDSGILPVTAPEISSPCPGQRPNMTEPLSGGNKYEQTSNSCPLPSPEGALRSHLHNAGGQELRAEGKAGGAVPPGLQGGMDGADRIPERE